MLQVDLVYHKNHPHIGLARENLFRAFFSLKMTPHWQEWELSDRNIPAYLKNYQQHSCCILVNCLEIEDPNSLIRLQLPDIPSIIDAIIRSRPQFADKPVYESYH